MNENDKITIHSKSQYIKHNHISLSMIIILLKIDTLSIKDCNCKYSFEKFDLDTFTKVKLLRTKMSIRNLT